MEDLHQKYLDRLNDELNAMGSQGVDWPEAQYYYFNGYSPFDAAEDIRNNRRI